MDVPSASTCIPKDAGAEGKTEYRIYALPAWEETPFFTDRERTALALTEAITLVREGHVPDEAYEKGRKSFSDEELVNLTLAIVTINGWNRLAITFRFVPVSTSQERSRTWTIWAEKNTVAPYREEMREQWGPENETVCVVNPRDCRCV